MARATITIDVPNEFLHGLVDDYWLQRTILEPDLTPENDRETKPTIDAWFRDRLQDVFDDELRVALWRWPVETEIVSIDV